MQLRGPLLVLMDLYPAIDIRGGRCVQLTQGDFDRETVYGDDPVAIAKSYEAAGAPWIHVVDLDAARQQGSNRELVEAVASAVGVPVQTGGGVRDGSMLESAVSRIVLGSIAIDDPGIVARLAASHPGRIAVGLDHRGGEIRYRGWEVGTGKQLLELVEAFSLPGVSAFVVTDIGRDGMLGGPDVEGLQQVRRSTDVPVIASGGVASLDDLRVLADAGAAGAIVGTALYEGRFTVEEALRACAR